MVGRQRLEFSTRSLARAAACGAWVLHTSRRGLLAAALAAVAAMSPRPALCQTPRYTLSAKVKGAVVRHAFLATRTN